MKRKLTNIQEVVELTTKGGDFMVARAAGIKLGRKRERAKCVAELRGMRVTSDPITQDILTQAADILERNKP